MKKILLGVAVVVLALAQTTQNGRRTVGGTDTYNSNGTLDAHGATRTLPHRTGTGSPNGRDNCSTLGETYYQTDATAGSNIWGCTTTGTPGVWTLQGSGGGGGGTSNCIVQTFLNCLPNPTPLKLILSIPTATGAITADFRVNSPSGSIYVVPSSRSTVCTTYQAYSPGGASSTTQVKISGSYWTVGNTAALSTSSFINLSFALTTGMGLAISTIGGSSQPVNAMADCVEYDSSGGPTTAWLTSFTAGADNTVFTCTATTACVVMGGDGRGLNTLGSAISGTGSITYSWKVGPSGSLVQMGTITPSANSLSAAALGFLVNNDIVTVNPSSTASGQIAWATYFRI